MNYQGPPPLPLTPTFLRACKNWGENKDFNSETEVIGQLDMYTLPPPPPPILYGLGFSRFYNILFLLMYLF